MAGGAVARISNSEIRFNRFAVVKTIILQAISTYKLDFDLSFFGPQNSVDIKEITVHNQELVRRFPQDSKEMQTINLIIM